MERKKAEKNPQIGKYPEQFLCFSKSFLFEATERISGHHFIPRRESASVQTSQTNVFLGV